MSGFFIRRRSTGTWWVRRYPSREDYEGRGGRVNVVGAEHRAFADHVATPEEILIAEAHGALGGPNGKTNVVPIALLPEQPT